ncbi:MAG: DUF2157 domain-containing protein [Nostocales cyanobacterium 94392]|nr:DUF2157 domain-containing protein [Nostocales cyanobacterium 94392]
MPSNSNRSLKFEVRLPGEHPHLLQGLDEWLRLDLISDAQVKQICQEHLVCQVILQAETVPKTQTQQVIPQPTQPSKTAPKLKATPNFFNSIWRSLRAELSVRWLLFLGMFSVVVSSGALAASQWERFTPVLQYGVLFAYTLGFWGIGFWTGKQANLRLTSGALHIVTMLLIPINFWAMDRFGLWQNPINWLLVGIASIILTGITVLVFKQSIFSKSVQFSKLSLINILGLSYLHWGWKFTGFPLIAVYLAVIGTTIITVFQILTRQQEVETKGLSERNWGKNVTATVIIYASMLVLVRAIFGAGVNLVNLGLAIGIYGWLIAWLAQQGEGEKESSSSWAFPSQAIGGVLLFLGWYVTVESNPLQAITISGLGLWFFNSRLHLYSLKSDFTAFFVVGLQSMWLSWRLLPAEFKASIVTTATQFTNSQNYPWALLSVGLFPYIIFMVAFTDKLYVKNKPDLASFGEKLTLILGLALTAVALGNPTLRSLNLLLSTITLTIVTHRHFNFFPVEDYRNKNRRDAESAEERGKERLLILDRNRSNEISSFISFLSSPLIYLTHITAILTLFSWINLFFPSLSQQVWAVICLVVMVTEWLFSVGEGILRRSAWHIGLVLAGLSYLLLWTNVESIWNGIYLNQSSWGLTWFITPVTLSIISSRDREERKYQQITISILSIIFAQLLTLPLPGISLIGLAMGVAVMFVNTRYLKNKISAVITVGFLLSFIFAAVWESGSLSIAGWFVLSAAIILSLWVIRKLLQRGNELANIYAVATDFWATILCGCELLLLSLHAGWVYVSGESDILAYAISAAIILVAFSFRHWQQPINSTFYGIAWCVELLVVEILATQTKQIIYVAVANIALGLITQLFGDWWCKKRQLSIPTRWHILPLLYALFGVLLRLNIFDSWTGLSTLGVALIVIGVGRRNQKLKPLLYLGLIGVSIAGYELLVYQLQQVSGGAIGDGWIALATLAAVIGYIYRLLSSWLISYLHLSYKELKMFAHFHWALGSVLLIAAINYPIEANILALATGLLLTSYAIFQGRQTDELTSQSIWINITQAEIWVYIGLVEAACLRYFLPDTSIVRLFLEQIRPWQAAVSCLIAYSLYSLPWQHWRWSKKPWQIAAYVIPLISLWETRIEVYSISILLVAGYYIFIAKITTKFRFTYISLILVNWALWRGFSDLNLSDGLWYISSIGLSLLYIAQFDPQLKLPQNKSFRHWLRMLGSGIICGYAVVFYQNSFFIPGLIPGILSLIAIFAGLALRIRAFLYIGTATFLVTAFYHLVISILRYPFLKWVIGLLVGISLIFIAANFESRRQQLTSLLNNTNDEFREWE